MQWLRSLVFTLLAYGAMVPFGILYAPWAIVSRDGARAACRHWCGFVIWLARWLVGIRSEVRGTPPKDECVIAAKHQSFLDIILIFHAVPRGKFIMKRELIWAPILGQYALRIGCIPVNRGKRAQAMRQMLADVAAGRADPGQLIIYPQGTRVPPGVAAPYKQGTAAIVQELAQPCVPVACNVGLFWPRRGILKHPGRAVVEFLDPIPPGLAPAELTRRLETVIEPASDRLLSEAGLLPG